MSKNKADNRDVKTMEKIAIKPARLTFLIKSLCYLIKEGEDYPISNAIEYINNGTILRHLRATFREKYDDQISYNLDKQPVSHDEKQIIRLLQASVHIFKFMPEDVGTNKPDSGLLFLVYLLITLISIANTKELEWAIPTRSARKDDNKPPKQV